MDPLRLLLVEDSTYDAELLLHLLRRGNFEPVMELVQSAGEMRRALTGATWDLVISDYNLPAFDAPSAFQVLAESGQDIPFIVASGSIGEETAVKMMKAGVHDYVLKNNPDRLIPAIRRELREAQNRRLRKRTEEENRRLEAERAELLERLKQENEDLTALTQITANAISSLDLEELLQALLGRVVEIMHADAATVLLIEGEHLRVRASRGVAQLSGSTHVSTVGHGFAGSVAAMKAPVYLEDASSDPLIQDPLIRARGLKTLIGVPLKRNGSLIGVLHAGWLAVRPRREREVHMLEITAERCAAAIQNARLYEQTAIAAAELRVSEERFRQLAEAIDEVYWMTDPEKGQILYISPAYEKVWGRTCASLYAAPRDWLEAIHPDDRERVAEASRTQGDGGYDLEYRIVRPDGTVRSVNDRAFPVRGPGGRVSRVVGVATDITVRKEAEEARRVSEARFKAIFDAEPECVKVVGHDGAVLEMNAAGLLMLQARTIEEVRGRPLVEFVVPEYRAAFEKLLQRAVEGESGRLEFEVQGLQGTRRWLDTHATPLSDPQGSRRLMLAVTRDITEERRAQEEVRLSLREKEALLKEVHHRVKNNLQVITSLLRLEGARSGEPAARQVLKDMQGRIQSMALLHETLYRAGSYAAIDLGAYLSTLATQLLRTLNVHSGTVELEPFLSSVTVGLDQAIPCGLLLHELVSNCLKHAFPNRTRGKIRIELQPLGDSKVCLRVKDDGVGLPPGFEVGRGQSLGLKLVSDLARQLRGRLEIEPGPGATFAVTFEVDPIVQRKTLDLGAFLRSQGGRER